MKNTSVSEIKTSKNPAEKILSHFLDYSEKGFYGEELSGKLKISAGASHETLVGLFKKRILRKERKGKTILYFLNEKNPVLKALKIVHSIEISMPLVEKLCPLAQKIYLFGSSASGEYISDSDIDLLVVCLEKDKKEIEKIVGNFFSRRPIQLVSKTASEWLEAEEKDTVFFRQVVSGINLFNRQDNEE